MMIVRLAALLAALVCGVSAASAASLTVQVTGVASNEGQVYVGLCPRSFDEKSCTEGQRQPAKAGTMRFTFPNVPAGRLAIAVYHDTNGNGRLDKQIFGLPAEPYGFSNDVGRAAPPSFEGALVTVSEPRSTVSVRVAPIRVP